jgi:hypothetical protein
MDMIVHGWSPRASGRGRPADHAVNRRTALDDPVQRLPLLIVEQ